MAWLPGWYYRKKITVSASNVDQTLSNFPLRVPFSQTDVSGSQSSGNDLRFTTVDGTRLHHVWTGFTENGYSGAYVQIPAINTTTGAEFHVYYGNPSASEESDPANTLSDYHVFWTGDHWTDGQYDLTGTIAVSRTYGTCTASNLTIGGGIQLDEWAGIDLGTTGAIYSLIDGSTGWIMSHSLHDWQDDSQQDIENFVVGDNSGTDYRISWKSSTQQLYNDTAYDKITPVPGHDFSEPLSLSQISSFRIATSCHIDGINGTAASYCNGTLLGSHSNSNTATSIQFPAASLSSTDKFRIGWSTGYSTDAVVNQIRIKKHDGESVADIAAWLKFEHANLMNVGGEITFAEVESLPVVAGPYQAAVTDSFQTDAPQAETFIPGIIAGHTYGT